MTGTFSEHWHRVAGQKLALRPTVTMRKQWFRGEKWFVVVDPLNNDYYRLTPGAHDFLCRLDGSATVQEVWEKSLERIPDEAPGQEAVIQLLAQLYRANLLRGEVPADSEKLFEQYRQRRQREHRSWWNLMFLRIPVFDPDLWLRRALPYLGWLIGPLGALLWLGVVGSATKVAIEHASELTAGAQSVLAPANLPLLYLGLVIIKALHEFGHAFACRRFGGEVHQMGVALIYFSPVPYVDASASWTFPGKWQRIFVSSAGMIAEFFLAALAVFVWAATGPGPVHSVAYNMMFVASVTTLLFNANPLMRYDGYYILADLVELPNLQQRATAMLQWVAERGLFGVRTAEYPARSRREAAWLLGFGAASFVYRVLLLGGIALFVSDRFLLLGVLLALGLVFSFTLRPLWQVGVYLAASPRLARVRTRAVFVSIGGASLLLALLALWPMPHRFRAPGIVRAEEYSEIFTTVSGTLEATLVDSGSVVQRGQPLLRFRSPELDLEIAAARASLDKAVAEEQRALERSAAELEPTRARRAVMASHLRRLEEKREQLVVTAPHAGTWFAPRLASGVGQWFPRGERLGQLIQTAAFRFSAVVSQTEAAELFSGNVRGAEVRLAGSADRPMITGPITTIPAQQEQLPSAALGWLAGGEIAVAAADPNGTRAAETFFELRAPLPPAAATWLRHGHSGKIRVELTPEPLLQQWTRELRQLLQKRYQL